jgi:hypothetical protein
MQRSCHQSLTISWLSLEFFLIPDARILGTQLVLNSEVVDRSQMVRHSKLLFNYILGFFHLLQQCLYALRFAHYSLHYALCALLFTLCAMRYALCVDPDVADLNLGKTCQSASDVAAHRLGQDEAYLTVRDSLSEASTVADAVLWCERSDFGRFWFASLGSNRETSVFP